MGKKKNKNKRKKSAIKSANQTYKPKGRGRKLDTVKCVKCPISIKPVYTEDCAGCAYHDNWTCTHTGDRIQILSMSTPHRYNTKMTQAWTDVERDSALNYYVTTKIMRGTKSIPKDRYPGYAKALALFHSGKIKNPEKGRDIERVGKESFTPEILLEETEDVGEVVLHAYGHMFKPSKGSPVLEGNMVILYYLYDLYSLDGHSDLRIDGRNYKVTIKPRSGSVADKIVVKNGSGNLIIGGKKK